MTDTETFADHPVSLAEIKSDRSRSAKDWTPRDALIAVLRLIDRGELHPDVLVISFREKHADGETTTGYRSASPDGHTSIGVLAYVTMQIASGADGVLPGLGGRQT